MLLKWDTGQEVYMLNQNDVREKFHDLKGNIQNFFHKFQKSDSKATAQADGVIDDTDEFTPVQDGEQVATAPRTRVIFSDGSPEAQKLVWDNEDASMQDKSYSFDEESTDADYDFEDDFEFEDDTDTGSGQEARYR
jgi:hypothetical protein